MMFGRRILLHLLSATPIVLIGSCRSNDVTPAPEGSITTDARLFAYMTQIQPYTEYRLFPNADSVTSGTLNGSTAHQPLVRVSMNETAYGALQADTLAAGSSFPDGSIVVKEIIEDGATTLFAVMYKDRTNGRAARGWVWAELYPDGRVFYSINERGGICTGCHASERGEQNDLVRTFERQRR
jgi:hypothetical protein